LKAVFQSLVKPLTILFKKKLKFWCGAWWLETSQCLPYLQR
jgi:hypothetical protein